MLFEEYGFAYRDPLDYHPYEVRDFEIFASKKNPRALVGCVWETMVGNDGRFGRLCRHICGNE